MLLKQNAHEVQFLATKLQWMQFFFFFFFFQKNILKVVGFFSFW